MKTALRRSLLGLLVVLVLLQLVPVDRSNPPVVSPVDAPPEVETILRQACFDCHSNETRWPWYGYVAPLSWWMAHHIEEARGDLNFSDWPVFDFAGQELAFRDIVEQIEKDEMPLKSYRIMHRGARLSDRERRTILDWARSGALLED